MLDSWASASGCCFLHGVQQRAHCPCVWSGVIEPTQSLRPGFRPRPTLGSSLGEM